MIEKCHSLKAADAILSFFEYKYQDFDIPIVIECYQNGREQGYQLCNYEKHKYVLFAENRNSDDIVIYSACRNQMQSIDEETWSTKKGFSYDKYSDAIKYIAKCLGIE